MPDRHDCAPPLSGKGESSRLCPTPQIIFCPRCCRTMPRLLRPHLHPVELRRDTVLYEADDVIGKVYLPHTGIISLVVETKTGHSVEVGMLGRNGVVGAGSALNGLMALNRAIVQAESSGMMIQSSQLKRLAHASETLRSALSSQDQASAAQTQQICGVQCAA
jgi:CRP-like cAMP-binding protein